MKWTELNWTERLAKIWNLGKVKLQTRNWKLRFAVSHEKPNAKGLYYQVKIIANSRLNNAYWLYHG